MHPLYDDGTTTCRTPKVAFASSMKWKRWTPTVVGTLALAVVVRAAMANSTSFSFTMEKRDVLGKRNKQLHVLDEGNLTFSGDVWVVSKSRGASATPEEIEVRVRENGVLDLSVCSTTVKPGTIFNTKHAFSKSCGAIKSGTYWVHVSRVSDDGWDIKGAGTLVTSRSAP